MTEWHVTIGRIAGDKAYGVYAKTFNASILTVEEIEDAVDDALRKLVFADRTRVAQQRAEKIGALEATAAKRDLSSDD